MSEDKRNKKIVKPLNEHGPNLPIGFGEGKSRSIAFKVWNLKREKQVGEIQRKSGNNIGAGEWVSILLSEMVTQMGPHDFNKLNTAEKRLIINQMYMPDVMFAYCLLRYEAMGNELGTDLECPFCGNKFSTNADLNTLDIRSVEKVEDKNWIFELKRPINIRGKDRKTFVMGPTRWATVEQAKLGKRINPGKFKSLMISKSIQSIDDESIILSDNDLDEMTKLDLERLISDIDKNGLGPDLSIETLCTDERCERQFRTSLDWGYDSFFTVSSK